MIHPESASSTIEFSAPIRIVSEMNTSGHWTKRRKRFIAQHQELTYVWLAYRNAKREATQETLLAIHRKDSRIGVTLTRIAPRPFDDDNLRAAFKATRDFIANDIFGIDDGSPRIKWTYEQKRGKPKEYAIRVAILAHSIDDVAAALDARK